MNLNLINEQIVVQYPNPLINAVAKLLDLFVPRCAYKTCIQPINKIQIGLSLQHLCILDVFLADLVGLIVLLIPLVSSPNSSCCLVSVVVARSIMDVPTSSFCGIFFIFGHVILHALMMELF